MVATNDTAKDINRPIEVMVDRIVERFNPDKILLSGSYARGEAGADSQAVLESLG